MDDRNPDLKLILAVDAVFSPLTGIGRYALELAIRLQQRPEFNDIRYLGTNWISDPEILLYVRDSKNTRYSHRLFDYFRRRLSRYRLAVLLYGKVIPALKGKLLKQYGSYIYHSPNYFLAPHEGLSIATVHDLSIYHYPETHPAARVFYFEREFRKTIDSADWLITDSESIRHELIANFSFSKERITAVPLGVDDSFHPKSEIDLFPVLAEYKLLPGKYSLCVSTLEPRKNIRRLLAAYDKLPTSIKNRYPLIFVGGRGWHDDDILDALSKAELSGWARHIGYVPEQDLPYLYAGARSTCFVSLYEGFGLPVLESMASGVPVLTSNCTSMPEVASGCAMLCNPYDVDQISESLRTVLEDEDWRSISAGAGLKIASNMSWANCVNNTVEVYKQAENADRC